MKLLFLLSYKNIEIFDETVQPAMSGKPFKINLKRDATLKGQKVPIPYLDQLKKQLNEMEQLGVISAYEDFSAWCQPIVIALKKDIDALISLV